MASRFFRDPALQDEFTRNGYVLLDLLDPAGIASLRAEHTRLMQAREDGRTREHLYESSRMHALEWNLEVSNVIRQHLLGPIGRYFDSHELFGGTFLLKVPQVSTLLPLHQDWTVVDEDCYQSLFVWCPLVDTSPANGGLFVLPGSHSWFPNYRSGSMPSKRILPNDRIKEHLVDINLRAGHAIAYSDRLFHGSYGNSTPDPRIVFTARVNQKEAELLYYHRVDGDRVDVIRASAAFYLRNGEGLDRGELPEGSETIRTLSYRYQPITEDDLASKLR